MHAWLKLSLLLLGAMLAGYGAAHYGGTQPVPQLAETGFARVLRTNTLRCGYYVFPPSSIRDPNTGQLSGLSVDMMQAIAKKTGLKIEWAEEVTFSNWIPALQAKRFDAVCTPMWPDMAMGREVLFSRAMFYATLFPVVRDSETRFTAADLKQFNQPDLTVAVPEGDAGYFIAQEILPRTKLLIAPAGSDNALMAQNVISGKADFMLWDKNGYLQFNKTNPNALKPAATLLPIKIMPFSFAVGRDQFGLQLFLDNAVNDLLATGAMDRLLDQWEIAPGAFQRVALPYRP
jgi:polar amino acid transport system substrate-binding protein